MAQTLKFGNGTWATKKGSTLAFNDQEGNYKPLPFTTTRATSATRVNKRGLIETVGSDIPRIDFKDNTKGALLLEPQRANLYNYSEPTANEGSATDITYESFNWAIGFTNCVKFGDNSATRYRYGGTVSVSTEYTLSAFVIMDDLSEPIIGGQTSDKDFSFVLGGAIGVGVNSSVNMGNNIWRVSGTATTSASASTLNNGIIKYTSQSSKGFRVVGFQVEQGSYPTSYIPTQGSAVTRVADTASGSGNSEVFNDSEGVLFADMTANDNDATYKLISITNEQQNDNFISFGYNNDNTNAYKEVKIGGVDVFDVAQRGGSAINQNLYSKIALKYKSGNSSFYINGFEVDSSSLTYTASNVMSGLKFNYFNNTLPFYGSAKEIGYYDTALTDEELETLTSYSSLSELVTELNLNTL